MVELPGAAMVVASEKLTLSVEVQTWLDVTPVGRASQDAAIVAPVVSVWVSANPVAVGVTFNAYWQRR